jgi:ssDNA-binding Zn-finger/Zn-ribbon topoisomerase 1
VKLTDASSLYLYGPCPRCGTAPSAVMPRDSLIVVGCQNKECELYNMAFSPESWRDEASPELKH